MSDDYERLRAANERLESENAAMKLDLYFKDGRIDTLRSHLWDRGNELAEAQSQLTWYQEQMRRLEKQSRSNQRTIQGYLIKLIFLINKLKDMKKQLSMHMSQRSSAATISTSFDVTQPCDLNVNPHYQLQHK